MTFSFNHFLFLFCCLFSQYLHPWRSASHVHGWTSASLALQLFFMQVSAVETGSLSYAFHTLYILFQNILWCLLLLCVLLSIIFIVQYIAGTNFPPISPLFTPSVNSSGTLPIPFLSDYSFSLPLTTNWGAVRYLHHGVILSKVGFLFHLSKELDHLCRKRDTELYCLRCHDKMGTPICGACR